jgi:acyl-coenzyme A thioesterase PaaI-like protein
MARTVWRPSASHAGFQSTVHGGLTATVLDEIMVWACAVATRRFAVCAEMTVRYLRPLRPDQTYVVEGRLTADRRGRVFMAAAEAREEGGIVVAAATGKYMPLGVEAARAMLADVVGPLAQFVDL